jgi:hypothetical protein
MPFGQNNNPSYRGGSVGKTVNWRNSAITLKTALQLKACNGPIS